MTLIPANPPSHVFSAMTRTGHSRSRSSEEATAKPTTMRVIVPLQGVVQGRGGLVLGSVIPCALFYFLQLYLRGRNRSAPTPPPAPEDQLPEVDVLSRSLSRTHLSPRGSGGPTYVSGRASLVARSGDSPCDVGLRKVSEDPYDELRNPDGVIQLGLAENKVGWVCFVLYWFTWFWFLFLILALYE